MDTLTSTASSPYDVLIIGAGPAGLCLARALSGAGMRIGLIEQQPRAAVAQPAFDGREIALTQASVQRLRELGVHGRIEALDASAFSPLRDALVLNGASRKGMTISHSLSARSELGWLVSNHLIRQGAYDCVQDSINAHGDITLHFDAQATDVRTHAQGARLTLANGQMLHARLLVAADSRFSTTRRAVGIAAQMFDFGRSMLVCMHTHEVAHNHVAWEWFDHGQTLALLPMNDDPATGLPRSSTVLTLPSREMGALQEMPAADFGAEMARRFGYRLGAMTLVSTRHVYPLVGVYPRALVAQRFACVGDAAVGMHPVTAHGFNFGLLGIHTLSRLLLSAHASGQDIAEPALLARYQRSHLLATKPLYLATLGIARLYTSENPAANLLRQVALRAGEHFSPFKRMVAGTLTGLHS